MINNVFYTSMFKLDNIFLKLKLIFFKITIFFNDSYFDTKYNIDTLPWVIMYDTNFKRTHKSINVEQEDLSILQMRRLFETLKIPQKSTFVDLNCFVGKGLMAAAEYGFKIVKGVESSLLLYSYTSKNILRYKEKSQTETEFLLANINYSDFQLKDDENVFLLHNSLEHKTLENIASSLTRNNRMIWMICIEPGCRGLIEKTMTINKVEKFNILGKNIGVYQVNLS